MPDESLPSFELRLRMVNGETQNISSLSPLLSLDCRYWYVVPSTNKKDSFFKNIDDSTLKNLILKHTYMPKFASYNDVYFLPRIISLLKGRETQKRRRRSNTRHKRFSVKFCKLCFIAQIREFGFAWFRLPWLNEKSECDIHLTQLELIDCKSCKKTLDGFKALTSALSGFCYKCSAKLYEDNLVLSSRYCPTVLNFRYSTPIAKCFNSEIVRLFKILQKRAFKKMRKYNELHYLTSWEQKAYSFKFFSSRSLLSESEVYKYVLHLMFSRNTNDLLDSFSQLWTIRDIEFSSVTFKQEAIVGVNSNCDTCNFQRGCIY